MDWRKKEDIIKATGIDNIEFIVDYGVVEEVNTTSKSEETSQKALTWAKYGYGLEDADVTDPDTGLPLKMTIGAICDYNGETVFVSTAHGVDIGDEIYLHDYQDGYPQTGKIGTVIKKQMGNTSESRGIDACIIAYDKSSSIIPIAEDRYGYDIIGRGAMSEGDVVIEGATSLKVPAYMVDAYSDVKWNDPDHNDVQWYYNMYEMAYSTSEETKGGDSGAPILIEDGDNEYSLVGIYKGRKYTSDGYVPYGTKYGFIQNWFDLTLK